MGKEQLASYVGFFLARPGGDEAPQAEDKVAGRARFAQFKAMLKNPQA